MNLISFPATSIVNRSRVFFFTAAGRRPWRCLLRELRRGKSTHVLLANNKKPSHVCIAIPCKWALWLQAFITQMCVYPTCFRNCSLSQRYFFTTKNGDGGSRQLPKSLVFFLAETFIRHCLSTKSIGCLLPKGATLVELHNPALLIQKHLF